MRTPRCDFPVAMPSSMSLRAASNLDRFAHPREQWFHVGLRRAHRKEGGLVALHQRLDRKALPRPRKAAQKPSASDRPTMDSSFSRGGQSIR